MPNLPMIARALEATTERLAAEIVEPTNSLPRWSQFEWCIAEASAALHGVSALLASRLCWRGPARWHNFLAQQAAQTEQRHARILALQDAVDRQLRSVGISAVALKGAALCALGLYPKPQRPMADLDLLLRPADLEPAIKLLRALGYAPGLRSWRHVALDPPPSAGVRGLGEHADNPIKIELHVGIYERLPLDTIDITEATMPARPTPGLNPYPSRAALMRHLLLHAAGNMRARALRLIQLYDVALLGSVLGVDDWSSLLDRPGGARGIWWAYGPLMLTRHYFPKAVPDDFIEHVAQACPRWLRRSCCRQRISDVSWSNPHIQALPGVEWSRTVGEAIRFAASRVWPARTDLDELQVAAAASAYGMAEGWYRQSHVVRIVRWLLAAPGRPQSMYSVQQALDRERAQDGAAVRVESPDVAVSGSEHRAGGHSGAD